jgi:hypothetical protein
MTRKRRGMIIDRDRSIIGSNNSRCKGTRADRRSKSLVKKILEVKGWRFTTMRWTKF